jgi:hypothetical protein
MKFYCQRISIYIRKFLKSPSSLCSGVKDVEEYLHDTNSERNIDGNQKLVSYISGKAQSCNLHFYLCFPLFTFFAIFSFHLFCIYQSPTCDLLMKFEVLIFFSKKKRIHRRSRGSPSCLIATSSIGQYLQYRIKY